MSYSKTIFLLSLLIVPAVITLRGSKCLIIALEGTQNFQINLGGGTKGAYQAGAFEAMVDLLKSEDVGYDVVAGSNNSINHV